MSICALCVMVLTCMTSSAQYFTAHVSGDSMALVKIACAQVRTSPGHAKELSSQVIMGTPVRIISKDGGWYHVETPDGYKGYIISNSLCLLNRDSYKKWKDADRIFITGVDVRRIKGLDGNAVSDILPMSIVEKTGEVADTAVCVKLPDGRTGLIEKKYSADLDDFIDKSLSIDEMLSRGIQLMGTSYLWGGTSTVAMDCSGLVKILYQGEGIIIRRDASEQAETGTSLGTDFSNYEKGDLVFFKSANSKGIVHVGIYLGDGKYLHCSGMVKINSLDPYSNQFIPSNILVGACRIKGNEDTPGIIRLSSHPWYH